MARITLAWLALALSAAVAVPAAAQERPARMDVCLEVAAGGLDEPAWAAFVSDMAALVAERPALFPDPALSQVGDAGSGAWRLAIDAGHGLPVAAPVEASCLQPGDAWGARLGRAFLEAGADQMLAEAPTTPGITSSVDIEWYTSEGRLITRLVFAGPLDIPNGTCWLDETLSVDVTTGRAVVLTERGVETSPFAEGACGRFFEHLPDGGAAAQAAGLLPVEIAVPGVETLRVVTSTARLTEDAVLLGGSFEPR